MATSTPNSSSAFGITPPAPPSAPDISQYISIASQQIGQGASDVNSAILNQATVQQGSDASLAADEQTNKTILQKTYGDLASEFQVEQKQETAAATEKGKEQVGSTQVAAARSGVDTGSAGAFAAPIKAAQADTAAQIAQIAATYGAKETDIADTLAGNLQQVQEKIDQYTADGNTAMAGALTQVAQLKYEQQQQTISLAQQMASAESQYEQQSWKDYMDEVNAQHQQATLDVMSARLEQTASNEATANSLSQERIDQTQQKDQQAVLSDYSKALSAAAKTVKTSSSGSGITRESLIANLQETYPQLDPKSIENDVYATYPDDYN